MLAPWNKSYDKSRQRIEKQRHYFASKGLSSQSYGFSSSHLRMWEFDHKEHFTLKNWCFWAVVLEKTLESPLDCKEIQPIVKEINPEYLLEGLMLKLKLQISGHLMQRANSLEKVLMLQKIEGVRRRERQRMRCLDHWFNGEEFEQALGDGEVQESLVCCIPCNYKEWDMTEWLNNKWWHVSIIMALYSTSLP